MHGEKMHVNYDVLKNWEKDLEIPDLTEMYKLSELYQVPCERLIRLKDELFKPNLKLIRLICNAIGISVKTFMAIWIIILIAGVIFAFVYLYSTNKEIDRKYGMIDIVKNEYVISEIKVI